MCRRGLPRALALLAFLGAALALLAFALVRRNDAPADSIDMLDRDMLERRASYGSAGTPPFKRRSQPEALPIPLQLRLPEEVKPHPDAYALQSAPAPALAPNTAVVVDENAPLTQR